MNKLIDKNYFEVQKSIEEKTRACYSQLKLQKIELKN